MDLEQMKRLVAAAWILGAGIVGLLANISSLPAWAVFAVVGFGPPLVMLLLWQDRPQTLPEKIRPAR
jgi:hypothetical protein